MVAPGSGREACLSCRGSLGEELVCETPRGFKLGEKQVLLVSESRCCSFESGCRQEGVYLRQECEGIV